MELNRADMKLLTEAGYSAILRNIDTDVTPIFEALVTWMPEQAAGTIGLALQALVAGDFARADAMLVDVIAGKLEGGAEARAILALCRALQNDHASAGELARELEGQGGSAEAFATLLVRGVEDTGEEVQGLDGATAGSARDPQSEVSGQIRKA